MKKLALLFSLFSAACLLSGCFKTATYDEAAYNEAILLKEDTLKLMDKATEPHATHEDEITALLQRLEKARQSAHQRANNEISANQWNLLISKDANLVGGFFERWKSEGTLNAFFVKEAKKNIAAGFDSIAELEKERKQ